MTVGQSGSGSDARNAAPAGVQTAPVKHNPASPCLPAHQPAQSPAASLSLSRAQRRMAQRAKSAAAVVSCRRSSRPSCLCLLPGCRQRDGAPSARTRARMSLTCASCAFSDPQGAAVSPSRPAAGGGGTPLKTPLHSTVGRRGGVGGLGCFKTPAGRCWMRASRGGHASLAANAHLAPILRRASRSRFCSCLTHQICAARAAKDARKTPAHSSASDVVTPLRSAAKGGCGQAHLSVPRLTPRDLAVIFCNIRTLGRSILL